ncbi:hypothetical protein BT96DRAFT_709380 [Gymnopus androsaceus JB14]|uniref:Uncharacterized protein n=1 Tax=Gymnopus androsaceus JB14 TaxID=1447944 RepID=A0A6A4HPP7_9AGAR|nr:hypothetical protein BT96DRAFT_709380 [Gymnopus androsaceus JB14]
MSLVSMTAPRGLLIGPQAFDAFSDGSGHTRLTFTPNSFDGDTTLENQQTVTDVEICYSFMKKIFNDANHILHGDEADQHMKEEFTNSRGLNSPQMESTGDPEISPIANMPQAAKRPPRREIIWNPFGFSNSSLSYISQNYDSVIFNDRIQLPRRRGRSVMGYRRACSCEGYTREEITFTPDAFRNVVLIYQQPSPNERCGQCGELLPAPSIIPQPPNHTAPYLDMSNSRDDERDDERDAGKGKHASLGDQPPSFFQGGPGLFL